MNKRSLLSKGQRIRKNIFDIYYYNLKGWLHARGNVIIDTIDNSIIMNPIIFCPLCMYAFNENSIYGQDPIMTLEHLPPKALGGKARLLICKKCNNTSGHKFDNHLLQSMKIDPWIRNEVNARLTTSLRFPDDKKIRAIFNVTENREIKIILDKASNPHHYESIKDYIQSPGEKEFKFQFQVPRKENILFAYLKIAYLYGFSYFGYSYLFNENTQKIRRAIINKDLTEIKSTFVLLNTPFTKEHLGSNIITAPSNFRSMVIVFAIQIANKSKIIGLVLPGPYRASWDTFESLSKSIGSNEVTFKHVKNLSFLNIAQSSGWEFEAAWNSIKP